MEEDASVAELSKPKRILRQYKTLLIILSILITVFGFFVISLVLYTWDRGLIAKGVVIGIPIGKLSIEEAQQKLEQQRNKSYQRVVHFISDNERFQINMKELGLVYNYDDLLKKAYQIGREGTIIEKAISKYKASWGINLQPDYHWNDGVLAQALTTHLSSLNTPAEDAYFLTASNGSLDIIKEKVGRQVDLDFLLIRIKTKDLDNSTEIIVQFKEVQPHITKTDLESLKESDLLSEYTTYFDANLEERTLNIKLAAKAIDGMVLEPGEEFSFNNTVGPRTIEAGFQTAMIIEGNKFVPGLGGGVCQVSSTLYNTVRLASSSLSVVERSRHSLPVKYVPPGQDATVAYPNLDFKFRNDANGYLLIRGIVNSNSITFKIFGKAKKSPINELEG